MPCRLALPGPGVPLVSTIVEAVHSGRRVSLRVQGELDLATTPVLHEALVTAFQQNPVQVEVDLEAVTFLDAVAVGVLEQAAMTAAQRGIAFSLTKVSGQALRILEVTSSDLPVRDGGEEQD